MVPQKLFTRNFTLLLLGQISSLLGNYTLKFALSMYVLDKTGSASIFASLLAAALLPTILLSPLGGILADRADRRRSMVTLDVLSGASVAVAGLLLPLGQEIGVIAGLLVVLSVLAAFESPTVQACIPQMLPPDQLMKGNAAVNQVQAIAGLVTPFLGSVVYTAFGLMPVLWGTVVCFWLTAALECGLHLKRPHKAAPLPLRTVLREEFSAGFHFLRRERPEIVKLLLLAALASLFVAGTVVVGFPFLVRTVLGLPAGYYGAAESAMGVAAVLGSLFVGLMAQRFRLRWLALVFVGLGLCLLPAGLVFRLPLNTLGVYLVLLLAFCAGQFGCSLFSTCAVSVIQARTPDHLMGKVMACVFTLSMCAQPVGQIVYGALFDWFARSPGWVLIPSGLLVCAIGCLSARFFLRLESH